MKVAVYRKDIIDALNRVVKVVPSGKVSPILSYVLAEAANDVMTFTATDISNFVSVKVVCKIGEPGLALIPAQDFLFALKTLKQDGVAISFEETLLKLRSGTSGWNWKTFDPKTFPQIPQWEQSRVFIIDKDKFHSAARKVKVAAASNSFSTNLEQVGFFDGCLQASDLARFHQIRVDDSSLNVALPLPFLDDLVSILPMLGEEEFEMGTNSSQDVVIVKCGDVVLASKIKSSKFPDLNKAFILPSMTNYSFVRVDRIDFLEAVRRVRIVSDKASRSITLGLSASSSKMSLMSRQPSGSFATDEIDVECDPQNREIVLNVDHLVQGVNAFDDDVIEFKLGNDSKGKPSTVFINQGNCSVVLNQLRTL